MSHKSLPSATRLPDVAAGLAWGAVAGAAGATALNLATYVDMLLRARPASEAPQQLVEEIALDIGVTIPGDEDERQHRMQALGSLSGLLTGIAVGAAAGAARAAGVRLPALVAVPVLGAAAMAAADLPLMATRVSDPREWAPTDWAADAIPHLIYGAIAHAILADEEPTIQTHNRSIAETPEALHWCAEHESFEEVIDIASVNTAIEQLLEEDIRFWFVVDNATLTASSSTTISSSASKGRP